MKIGVDMMGGERPPSQLFQGVIEALKSEQINKQAQFVVYATDESCSEIKRIRDNSSINPEKIQIIAVKDAIKPDEHPLRAIRQKRESSIVIGIRHLSEQFIDAFISPGSTGALVAAATVLLDKLPGIRRPALLTLLPSANGKIAVLDVGGLIDPQPEQLLQFAIMGSAYQQCINNLPSPKVGLLNIGTESLKGTDSARATHRLLQDADENKTIKFIGNVEGKDVFNGKIDVLVTDGFTGNVFLKTAEGVSAFLLDSIKQAVTNVPEAKALLTSLSNSVDYDKHPGAIVCGLNQIVIKCHGYSTPKALASSLIGTSQLIENRLIQKIKSHLL